MPSEVHVSNGMCGQVLRFVGRRAGPAAVERVLNLAGETRSMAEHTVLEDIDNFGESSAHVADSSDSLNCATVPESPARCC